MYIHSNRLGETPSSSNSSGMPSVGAAALASKFTLKGNGWVFADSLNARSSMGTDGLSRPNVYKPYSRIPIYTSVLARKRGSRIESLRGCHVLSGTHATTRYEMGSSSANKKGPTDAQIQMCVHFKLFPDLSLLIDPPLGINLLRVWEDL